MLSNLPDFRKRYNLVVPSKRIAAVATKFAFRSVTSSEGASDEKLYETIMSLRPSANA